MEQLAALRADWLAQLAAAIDGAQRLAWQLGSNGHASGEARELYGRLEEVRAELNALHAVGGRYEPHAEQDWLQALGWTSRLDDPAD